MKYPKWLEKHRCIGHPTLGNIDPILNLGGGIIALAIIALVILGTLGGIFQLIHDIVFGRNGFNLITYLFGI